MHINNFTIYACCMLIFPLSLSAQNGDPVHEFQPDELIGETLELVTESTGQELDFSDWNQELDDLLSNPVNLNSANEDELHRLPLLNDLQIQNLKEYASKYGSIASIYELFLIDGFSQSFIEQIAPFITLEAMQAELPQIGNALNNGRWKLSCRYQRILEPQAGYSKPTDTDSSSSRYSGSPDAITSKLIWNYRDLLQWGITMEKDAGESLFRKPDSLSVAVDFLSFHMLLRGKGKLRTAVLGDYQLQFGQGLTIWSGLSMGKLPGSLPMRRRSQSIKPHTSANENNFLRGAATSWKYRKMECTAFASYRRRDARLSIDTMDRQSLESFTSLQDDGYHRTATELRNRKTILEFIAGGNVKYNGSRLKLGITAYQINFDKTYLPEMVPGKFGTQAGTFAGIDYSWSYKRFTLYGESSAALSSGMAHLVGINLNPDPRVSFAAIYRIFSTGYSNPLAAAFGESAQNSNERGLYIGVQTTPVRNLSVTLQVDLFRYPWLRYQVDAPSSGNEYASYTSYSLGRNGLITFSIKHSDKQKNTDVEQRLLHPLGMISKTSGMMQIRYTATSWLKLSTRTSVQQVKTASGQVMKGYYLGADGQIVSLNSVWSFTARYAVFDTDDYESRIYIHENDLPSSFSIPAFSGNGSRYFLLLKMKLGKHLNGWLRYSQTIYHMQQEISSGLSLIEGNHKSEIKAMINYTF